MTNEIRDAEGRLRAAARKFCPERRPPSCLQRGENSLVLGLGPAAASSRPRPPAGRRGRPRPARRPAPGPGPAPAGRGSGRRSCRWGDSRRATGGWGRTGSRRAAASWRRAGYTGRPRSARARAGPGRRRVRGGCRSTAPRYGRRRARPLGGAARRRGWRSGTRAGGGSPRPTAAGRGGRWRACRPGPGRQGRYRQGGRWGYRGE